MTVSDPTPTPKRRPRCDQDDCIGTPVHSGRCLTHYQEFCRRAGSFAWEGFDQEFADLMGAAGFEIVGSWPVVEVAL